MRAGVLLRSLRAGLRSPVRAWLAVRMLGWALVLPLLTRRVPLDRLVSVMCMGAGRRGTPGAAVTAADVAGIARWAHRFARGARGDNCLQRSLLVYRQLAAIGVEPVLRIGARPGGERLEGHVWVTVEDVPVHDQPEDLAGYVTLTAYGPVGRRGVPT